MHDKGRGEHRGGARPPQDREARGPREELGAQRKESEREKIQGHAGKTPEHAAKRELTSFARGKKKSAHKRNSRAAA